MKTFEQYQKAIDELTTRQRESGRGWNPGYQLVIDTLREAQMNLPVPQKNESGKED